jgi:DNA-binding MarR family transcriptional regulator
MSSVSITRSSPSDPLPTDASHDGSPKHALLRLLACQSDLDARSVAQELGCTHAAAGMLLLRLTRHGLIQRAFDPEDRVYFHNLTAKGRARLAYWAQLERQKR